MILAAGRRSEPGEASLVCERVGMIAENASSETPSSRTMRIAAPVAPALRAEA
ncbi:hypothetical protein GIV52_00095 [Pseudomonas syringae]|uniref:Uncharacterized protein n=1 Tax=Pseudomonas syringae TaxID=317 RepID=A0A9Q4A0K0_PSESX|nr:hypothetical protein [Pseudomonas syringae]MCF5472586.1 hypothetical protein [Pseudomonas syringae]MCF5481560.1 hypothetical protein [Pseudomonas syringae]MCF5486629.1 hypothetical protein [Pseudomonas syringae]MCF5491948.1 hypothetical protein [Pseudomonas syringae]